MGVQQIPIANLQSPVPDRWSLVVGRWSKEQLGLAGLLALSAITGLIYALGITARYPLVTGLRQPRAGWYVLSGHSLHAGFVFAALIAGLTICYMLALRLALRLGTQHRRSAFAIVVGGWLVSSAVLLGAYPGESFDIFEYLFRGRMLVEFGASPLAVAPSVFQHQPFYGYITWRWQVDTYGPLWEYASGAVAWGVHYVVGRADSQVAYIVGYRALAIVLAGLCGALVAAIVSRNNPRLALAALAAWLWNPLLVIATAMGAHNDILMLLALLLALLLLQRQRRVLGLLALALAAHVKLTALLILPIVGLWLVRRYGWRSALRDGAVALALAVPLSWLLYAPLGGWATLPRMLQERARLLVDSPSDLVYRLLQERYAWAEPPAWRATTLGATLLFVLVAAVLAWLLLRPPTIEDRGLKIEDSNVSKDDTLSSILDPRSSDTPSVVGRWSLVVGRSADDALLWRGCVAIMLAYLLIGSFWFQHWYLLWVLAPAALLPASRWTQTLLPVYGLGALWGRLANSFLIILPGRPFTATQVSAINVLAQVTPLLAILVLTILWWRLQPALAQLWRLGAASASRHTPAPSAYETDRIP